MPIKLLDLVVRVGRKIDSGDLVLPYLIMALPFLTVVIGSNLLRTSFPIGMAYDEVTWHYPGILRIGATLPNVNLVSYNSATTPLFHLSCALFGKLVGFELFKLRLLNVVFSYAAVVVLYLVLTKRLRVSHPIGLSLALLFEMTPYFFTSALVLNTDNLAWLFVLLAVYFLLGMEQSCSWKTAGWAAFFSMLAILTRQSMLSVALLFPYFLLKSRMKVIPDKVLSLVIFSASLLPLLAFVWIWHGLVPPEFAEINTQRRLNSTSVFALLCLVGAYFPFVVGRERPSAGIVRVPKIAAYVLVGVVASVILLLVLPMRYVLEEDFGLIWRISTFLPSVAGTSVLFWLLLPIGFVSVFHSLDRLHANPLPLLFVVSFTAPYILNKLSIHRYYDPIAILFLIFFLCDSGREVKLQKGVFLLMALFVVVAIARVFFGI